MLSISGMRGITGGSFTPEVSSMYARAFAAWLGSADGKKTVCVARDGRRGGEVFLEAVRESLLDAGCDVIDLGVVMTPTVGVAIGHHRADGAMVVTASHNPQEWNGLKALNADGLAPPAERAAELVSRFRAMCDDGERQPHGSTASRRGVLRTDNDAAARHVEAVLGLVDVNAIRGANFRIVLDSVNASGCMAGRQLLERLGCQITHLNGELTGVFPHAPEPLEANLGELMRTTADKDAACGFAQDPDADRLAIVDERGRYIGEECTLALAATRMLEIHGPGVLAANLSTSRMIDAVAARFPDSRVIRTAVGEANVAGALRRANGLMGGEGNGGVIIPKICWIRDSLSAMALVLDLLASRGTTLSAIVGELPKTVMIKSKLDLAGNGGAQAVGPALERLKHAWPEAQVNTIDGVRIDFDDGWVHLRASNTEPIIRIIAEAETAARAEALVADCRRHTGLV